MSRWAQCALSRRSTHTLHTPRPSQSPATLRKCLRTPSNDSGGNPVVAQSRLMDHQNGAMYPGVGAPHAQSPARPSFFPSGASSPATPNPNSGSFAGSPTPHSFADPRNRYQNPYLQQAADGAAAQGPFNGAGGFAVPSGAPNGNMMPSQADGGGAFVQPQPRRKSIFHFCSCAPAPFLRASDTHTN